MGCEIIRMLQVHIVFFQELVQAFLFNRTISPLRINHYRSISFSLPQNLFNSNGHHSPFIREIIKLDNFVRFFNSDDFNDDLICVFAFEFSQLFLFDHFEQA